MNLLEDVNVVDWGLVDRMSRGDLVGPKRIYLIPDVIDLPTETSLQLSSVPSFSGLSPQLPFLDDLVKPTADIKVKPELEFYYSAKRFEFDDGTRYLCIPIIRSLAEQPYFAFVSSYRRNMYLQVSLVEPENNLLLSTSTKLLKCEFRSNGCVNVKNLPDPCNCEREWVSDDPEDLRFSCDCSNHE